jgi:hypothetical protein
MGTNTYIWMQVRVVNLAAWPCQWKCCNIVLLDSRKYFVVNMHAQVSVRNLLSSVLSHVNLTWCPTLELICIALSWSLSIGWHHREATWRSSQLGSGGYNIDGQPWCRHDTKPANQALLLCKATSSLFKIIALPLCTSEEDQGYKWRWVLLKLCITLYKWVQHIHCFMV